MIVVPIRREDLFPTTILLNIIAASDNVNRMLIHVNQNEILILSAFVLHQNEISIPSASVLQLIPLQEKFEDVIGPNVQKLQMGIITRVGNFDMTFQAFIRPPLDRIIVAIPKMN